jgi:hypothetical protein
VKSLVGALRRGLGLRNRNPGDLSPLGVADPGSDRLDPSPRGQVGALGAFLMAEFDRQRGLASEHIADSYWTDGRTGHNVGEDEIQAVRFLEAIDLAPGPDEAEAPDSYAARLWRSLNASRSRFRSIELDPDGYGLGTFGEVIAALEKQCDLMGIDLPEEKDASRAPDADWYELDRQQQDAKFHAQALVRDGNLFLLMDQIQIAIFLTLIRIYRERDTLSDAEIAYYSKELYDLRSMALLGISSIPRILLGYFYRYVAGLSNAVSILRTTPDPDLLEQVDRLPYTNFGFDFEAGKRAITEQGAGTSVYRYTEDTPHAYILNGLNYLEAVATPSELALLDLVFRDPAEALLGAGSAIRYHYLEAQPLSEDARQQSGESVLFCLAVRPRDDGTLDVQGWNCGPAGAIYGDIHQLALMAAFDAAVTRGEAGHEAANQLFGLSQRLRPEGDQEPCDGERIIIIAEGPTALFPFAALGLRDGTRLAERSSIVMPLNATGRPFADDRGGSFASAVVISVAEQAPDGSTAALPDAAGEGEAIAQLWNCAHLRDDAADPVTASHMLEQHALVHIATHGLVRGTLRHLDRALAARDPVTFLTEAEAAMDAAAMVAGGRATDGSPRLLSGQDIRKLDLSSTRLVFLSLCGGASARAVGGEAAFGLAQSLVRAGTAMVVATIYPVADAVAREVATRFHWQLATGVAPAEALRRTQLAMAAEGYGWHSWGGYQLLV